MRKEKDAACGVKKGKPGRGREEMDSKLEEEILVHEEFLLCGGAETQVVKCGPWTDLFNDQSVHRPKMLIFIITDPNAQEIKDIYGLRGQIEHKIAFLRSQVPKDVKLILVGHSVGSYMVLQMLKYAPELPVIRAFLLFPAIERMAETPNGRIFTPLLCWFRYVLYATDYLLLTPCPDIVKSWLISLVLRVMNLKAELTLTNVIQPFCLANAFYLGAQEMMTIVKRDDDVVKEHLSKLTFYYGTSDSWCPIRYYDDIKKVFPEGDIRLCEKNIPHAFVLHFSQDMAEMIATWVKDNLSEI
ncbi:lipid droplet-associated hydrolase isoform X3 [Fukomys damarensis]|uniref:lipid droplet-associated hydrolase isoform X3 n=1 Tax=Fukomys damarensis TaxID=885580 RepID=UPI0014552136|nr:lipid droplet-associated hydrolase isoform X3 [Fukomys damarensis]